MLWRDSLIMFDRSTKSLWSQVLGAAVAGPQEGRELTEIPAEQTTWEDWKQRHPDTLVLVKPKNIRGTNYADYHRNPRSVGVLGTKNPDSRMRPKSLVFGMEEGGDAAAIPFGLLQHEPVLNVTALGKPLVVFSSPGEQTALVFERTVDGEELFFERVEGDSGRLTVKDTQSGSTWSWEDGSCLQGPFEGTSLTRVPGTAVYWGIWAQFHPETALVRQGEQPPAKQAKNSENPR